MLEEEYGEEEDSLDESDGSEAFRKEMEEWRSMFEDDNQNLSQEEEREEEDREEKGTIDEK